MIESRLHQQVLRCSGIPSHTSIYLLTLSTTICCNKMLQESFESLICIALSDQTPPAFICLKTSNQGSWCVYSILESHYIRPTSTPTSSAGCPQPLHHKVQVPLVQVLSFHIQFYFQRSVALCTNIAHTPHTAPAESKPAKTLHIANTILNVQCLSR